MSLAIMIIAGAIVLIEIASYMIYRSKSLEGLRKLYSAVLKRKENVDDIRTFNLRYNEHPFLIMTANPDFRNSLGEKIHNRYGFREKDDFTDLGKGGEVVIYCDGGSSTYCNFIERNEDTWPGVLEKDLNSALVNKKARVVNAAVSGWNSYQGLIRFSAWVDIMKPKLVIIYHGKNDLVPFAVGSPSVHEIFPDYSNVMHSVRFDLLAKKLPILAKCSYTGKVLYGVYMNHRYANMPWHIYHQTRALTVAEYESGLKRIGEREWEAILSRYRSFAAMCKHRNITALFVTQKVSRELYKPYMDELNRRIRSIESKEDNCFVYEFAEELQETKGLLDEGGHFTEDGARLFSGLLKEYILNNIPLFKDSRERSA